MLKRIIIVLDGGIVLSVEGLPEGYELVARDYDVDSMDENSVGMKRDENDILFWEYQV